MADRPWWTAYVQCNVAQSRMMASSSRFDLVKLDRDHPGFRDPAYRSRRNAIAELANSYRAGDPIPIVPYTPEENEVWRHVLERIRPIHSRYAIPEFLPCCPSLGLDNDH